MPPKRLTFIKDKYSSNRGKRSQLYNLHCRKCDRLVLVYQKDGPGKLLRLYLDRILSPKIHSEYIAKNPANIPMLICQDCGEILGMPYIYTPENRFAYRLFQDSLNKTRRNLNNQ